MRNEPFLDAVALCTARAIVERHAPDCADRQALLRAIARVARQGLDAHVRLFETQQSPATPTNHSQPLPDNGGTPPCAADSSR